MNSATCSKTLSIKRTAYCPLERQIPLFRLDRIGFSKCPFAFDSHDAARSFFLELQNEIKNMNFLPFNSERYQHSDCDRLKQKNRIKKEKVTNEKSL